METGNVYVNCSVIMQGEDFGFSPWLWGSIPYILDTAEKLKFCCKREFGLKYDGASGGEQPNAKISEGT